MDNELTDARAEKQIEDYIYKWSKFEFITNFFLVYCSSYFSGLFVMVFALQFNIDLFQYFSFTQYIFPIIFTIIILFRKKIINKAIQNVELDSLYFPQKKASFFLLFLSVYTLSIIYLNKIYSNIIPDISLLLIACITVLYMPIYFTFSTILTETGCIFIEFSEFSTNIYNFDKRQRWLTKICKRVSDIFKKGNIVVDKNKLRSEFNFQMGKGVNMKPKINEMKNWFLSEDKNDNVFTIFEKIWPNVTKKPYIRKTRYEYIGSLPPYQYVELVIKVIMGIILIVIVMIMNPLLIMDIIKTIIGLL